MLAEVIGRRLRSFLFYFAAFLLFSSYVFKKGKGGRDIWTYFRTHAMPVPGEVALSYWTPWGFVGQGCMPTLDFIAGDSHVSCFTGNMRTRKPVKGRRYSNLACSLSFLGPCLFRATYLLLLFRIRKQDVGFSQAGFCSGCTRLWRCARSSGLTELLRASSPTGKSPPPLLKAAAASSGRLRSQMVEPDGPAVGKLPLPFA